MTEGFLVGKHMGEFAGIPAIGKNVCAPICMVYDINGGFIQKARIYFQMATLMQQLGFG